MGADIFCCTYAGDARWLHYMLRSIERWARGFDQTVVVFPKRDYGEIMPVLRNFKKVQASLFDERPDGHLHQNVIKTSPDLYTNADFILHMDSDCVFTEEATPDDYMTEGRADILYTLYSELQQGHNGTPVPWRAITERALGVPCPAETMRRFPMLYPRWLYKDTRDRIAEVNGKPFEEYVFTASNIGGAFHGYSEFNALGCNAKERHPEKFFLYNTTVGMKPGKVKQYWSHSGLNDREKEELERIVA